MDNKRTLRAINHVYLDDERVTTVRSSSYNQNREMTEEKFIDEKRLFQALDVDSDISVSCAFNPKDSAHRKWLEMTDEEMNLDLYIGEKDKEDTIIIKFIVVIESSGLSIEADQPAELDVSMRVVEKLGIEYGD